MQPDLTNPVPASHVTTPCNRQTFQIKLKHVGHHKRCEIILVILGLQTFTYWHQTHLSAFIVVLQWHISPRDNGEVSIDCIVGGVLFFFFTDLVNLGTVFLDFHMITSYLLGGHRATEHRPLIWLLCEISNPQHRFWNQTEDLCSWIGTEGAFLCVSSFLDADAGISESGTLLKQPWALYCTECF